MLKILIFLLRFFTMGVFQPLILHFWTIALKFRMGINKLNCFIVVLLLFYCTFLNSVTDDILSIIPCLNKKNCHNCFCHNFVEFLPTLIIFGTTMAKTIELQRVIY